MLNYSKMRNLGLGLALIVSAPAAMAQFTLNWTGQGGNIQNPLAMYINCNRGEGSVNCQTVGEGPDPDTTPFLEEVVTINGQQYWHIIIGEPTSNFAQEVYISAGGLIFYGGQGSLASSSGGSTEFDVNQYPLSSNVTLSGNASGNPNRVVMQQIVNDDGMTEDFIKPDLLTKPEITQSLTTSDIQWTFSVDMTAISYNTLNTAAPVTQTLSIAGTPQANFNSASLGASATPYITAGEYIYTPGNGPDGSQGTYQYVDIGVVDPGENWAAFREPDENPPSKASPDP